MSNFSFGRVSIALKECVTKTNMTRSQTIGAIIVQITNFLFGRVFIALSECIYIRIILVQVSIERVAIYACETQLCPLKSSL